MPKHWEHFSHGSDIGIRGAGNSKEQAFEQIAIALTAVIADPLTVKPQTSIEVACEAADDEFLLVDWLNALIYEMAIRNMLFSRFDVHLDGGRLSATAWGEPVNVERHEPAVEVKGATYTELHLRQDPAGLWAAQSVVDV